MVSFPLDIYTKVESAILFLIFCAVSLLFSVLSTPIYNPTGFAAQGSLSSTSSPALVNLSSFLIIAILTGVKVILHCDFDLHFLDD